MAEIIAGTERLILSADPVRYVVLPVLPPDGPHLRHITCNIGRLS